MTEVTFHTGVADPLAYACRLLHKAHRQGARAWVTAPPEVLKGLDNALWVQPPQGFVPHVQVAERTPAHVLRRTPLWLAPAVGAQPDAPDILVNLGAEPPAAAEGLARIIELVGNGPDEVQAGRQRWRHYLQLGLKPEVLQRAASSA